MNCAPITLAALLVFAGAAAAGTPAAAPAAVVKSPAASGGGNEKEARFRLGVLGGLSMQKTDLELAAGYDFAKLGERVRLCGDFTLGLRPTEVTLEPMGGIRVPLPLPSAPKLEVYFEALAGVNLTFLRGGTGLAIPLRIGAGAAYQVTSGVGVGFALSMEAGPLFVPFAAPYGAAHFGVLLAWSPS
ncbi:MAG: hypothetical protein ACYC8T_17710 [Myxococcaceae bacterium]